MIATPKVGLRLDEPRDVTRMHNAGESSGRTDISFCVTW